MSVSEIRALPVVEKLRLMEALWEDLKERFDGAGLSPEIKAMLDSRRVRVEQGKSGLQDWDAVKDKLGRE